MQATERSIQINTATMCFFVVLWIVCPPQLSAQERLLWGSLEPGPYHVGFCSSFELDHARRYGTRPAIQGRSKVLGPRPILIAIWYPTLDETSPRIRYRDYLTVPPAALYPDLAARLTRFFKDTVSEDIFAKKLIALNVEERSVFERLLATQTFASMTPTPAAGRFPVVVYLPGAEGSWEDNSVLFEYLASYGYVVISSAYQSNHTHLANNIGGPSRSIGDMQFLLRAASLLPFGDTARLAAIGHSAGAQTILQWIGEDECPIDAFVSLDTTLEYTPAKFPGHKELRATLNQLHRPQIPIMLFASAERRPNFSTFGKYLQDSPRYEVSVKFLRHNDYLTHGAIRRALMPRSSGEESEAASVRHSYDQVCRTIKNFLNAYLKKDAQSYAALERSSKADGPLRLRYKAPF